MVEKEYIHIARTQREELYRFAVRYTADGDAAWDVVHLVVSGNCIVRLQQDTCNWISYTGAAPSDKERLVIIEGNKLTTTAAANDMTLQVGTTAGTDSAHYLLTFDVSDNGLVLYDGRVHTTGRTTIDGYDSSKRKSRANMGKKKYDESHRMHNDFFFGYNQWMTGDGRINDQSTVTPYHFAVGLRVNLFSLLAD